MIILILCIQKVRQRGHLICPRTAGKQQGQGWNQAGWLQNLPFSPSPFERISSKSYWMADLYHLLPWPDQPLQRNSILHMKHSNFVAIPTLLLVHLYQPLWIKPIYQKKKKKQWKQCWKEKSSQKEQANRVMGPSLALADCELLMDLNLLHLNYTVKRTKQSANHICEFCTLRHNHLWITNIQKKLQKVPKGKIWICCTSTTIYIALTLYLQLFTQNLCGISLK